MITALPVEIFGAHVHQGTLLSIPGLLDTWAPCTRFISNQL